MSAIIPTEGAIPWYKSQQFRAILTIVVTQIVSRLSVYVESKYHFDVAVLNINIADIVSWLMDTASAVGAYWALHARGTQKSAPQIVLTKSKADEINAPLSQPSTGDSQISTPNPFLSAGAPKP